MVAANRWLEEVYDPVIAAIPEDLRGRLPPAEIFHEVLEHRWYMSEAAGRDVGTTAAARDYFEQVLPTAPEPLEDTPGTSCAPLEDGCRGGACVERLAFPCGSEWRSVSGSSSVAGAAGDRSRRLGFLPGRPA